MNFIIFFYETIFYYFYLSLYKLDDFCFLSCNRFTEGDSILSSILPCKMLSNFKVRSVRWSSSYFKYKLVTIELPVYYNDELQKRLVSRRKRKMRNMSTYELAEQVCYRPLIFSGLRCSRTSTRRNQKKFRRHFSDLSYRFKTDEQEKVMRNV